MSIASTTISQNLGEYYPIKESSLSYNGVDITVSTRVSQLLSNISMEQGSFIFCVYVNVKLVIFCIFKIIITLVIP